MKTLQERLMQLADVEENRPLKEMTTFRIGGPARFVLYPKDIISLTEIVKLLEQEKVSYKFIGKGSNLLCSDQAYDGAIIRLDRYFTNSYFENNKLIAQAGSSIIALAYEAMKKGLSGLEFASGIPGTVGGTIFMNAGAYKASMADVVEKVLVLRDGQIDWIDNSKCEFAYRHSIFHTKNNWIILAASIQLNPEDPTKIRNLIDERRNRRMCTQPLDYPSAGSIFRNPENSFAWKYIDELGYRGKMIGGAQISEKHPNFIINKNEALAVDVEELIDLINEGISQKHGFILKTEVERFNWPQVK